MCPDSSPSPIGALWVVSTPIGNLGDLSERAAQALRDADLIACEDTRVTARLLQHLGLRKPTLSYHDHNETARAEELATRIAQGERVALVSDAGTPTLSDPGFRVVRACRQQGLPVTPVPGASALLAALAVSGLPTDAFYFGGFLPPKASARQKFFREHADFPKTIVLYESSHRIAKLMDDLLAVLGPERTVCVARELTKKHETVHVGAAASVAEALKNDCLKGEFVVIIANKDFNL